MLKAVRELGEYVIKDEGLELTDILTQSPRISEEGKIICVTFVYDGEDVEYDNTHIEDYKLSNFEKYLFRDHPSHRFNISPTVKLTKKEISNIKEDGDKNSNKSLFFQWFKNKRFEKYREDDFVHALANCVDMERERISSDIAAKYDRLDKKNNSILTIKILENGKEKYLRDFEIFKSILKEVGTDEIWAPDIPKEEGKCCLCGEKKEVGRPRQPFTFYTIETKGCTYDFSRENSWKQLPVCLDCAILLIGGKKFLDEHKCLRGIFYGYPYYIIPYFVFGEFDEEIMEYIKFYKDKEYAEGLVAEEYDLLEKIKEEEDVLNLIFLFYKMEKQRLVILRYVEDVPPSWIRRLYDTFDAVAISPYFSEVHLKKIFGDKWSGDFQDTLKRLIQRKIYLLYLVYTRIQIQFRHCVVQSILLFYVYIIVSAVAYPHQCGL